MGCVVIVPVAILEKLAPSYASTYDLVLYLYYIKMAFSIDQA